MLSWARAKLDPQGRNYQQKLNEVPQNVSQRSKGTSFNIPSELVSQLQDKVRSLEQEIEHINQDRTTLAQKISELVKQLSQEQKKTQTRSMAEENLLLDSQQKVNRLEQEKKQIQEQPQQANEQLSQERKNQHLIDLSIDHHPEETALKKVAVLVNRLQELTQRYLEEQPDRQFTSMRSTTEEQRENETYYEVVTSKLPKAEASEEEIKAASNLVSSQAREQLLSEQHSPWLTPYHQENLDEFIASYQPIEIGSTEDSLGDRWLARETPFTFKERTGSYWLVKFGEPNSQRCYLVPNRKKFRFNVNNLNSIRVCFDLNQPETEDSPKFNPAAFNLTQYEVVYPAEVLQTGVANVWQLENRGLLKFQVRVPETSTNSQA